MKNVVHWLLGNGHLTSLVGYVQMAMQLHDGGTGWHSVLHAAGWAVLGRLVPGGTVSGLPVK